MFSALFFESKMYRILAILVVAVVAWTSVSAGPQSELLAEVNDHKDFKKILRTKTNVLVLYVDNTKATRPLISLCQDVAAAVKGIGSIYLVNCGGYVRSFVGLSVLFEARMTDVMVNRRFVTCSQPPTCK